MDMQGKILLKKVHIYTLRDKIKKMYIFVGRGGEWDRYRQVTGLGRGTRDTLAASCTQGTYILQHLLYFFVTRYG